MTFKDTLRRTTAYTPPPTYEPPYAKPELKIRHLSVEETPPLSRDQRGLVVHSPGKVEYSPDGETTIGPFADDLEPQEVRFSLLFWDRLDFPEGSMLAFAPGRTASYLESLGILQRSKVRISAVGNPGEIVIESHLAAFRALDTRQPGQWSLSRGERTLSFPPREAQENRGLLFDLHDCIPVPDKDVPIEDLLEFKQKRNAELLAVRAHLEAIFNNIASDPQRPISDNGEIERLQEALASHFKVCEETSFPLRLAGLKAGISVDISSAIIAGVAASYAGLPLLQSLMVGAATAIPKLSLKSDIGLRNRRATTSPFEYISRYHRDLFRQKP